jgi:hypothetical protein
MIIGAALNTGPSGHWSRPREIQKSSTVSDVLRALPVLRLLIRAFSFHRQLRNAL